MLKHSCVFYNKSINPEDNPNIIAALLYASTPTANFPLLIDNQMY